MLFLKWGDIMTEKTHGGARAGAGRPFKNDSDKKQRPQHQVRAFDEEWELIKALSKIVKTDIDKAKKILADNK